MKRIISTDWEFYVPEGDGSEARNVLFDLNGFDGVDLEIRSSNPVEIRAVSDQGNTLFLDWGQVVSFEGKLTGFAAIEVVASSAFAYRSRKKGRWLEKPDQRRLAIAVDEAATKPLADLMREEVVKYMARREAAGVLGTDVSIAEFLDDIENGDLEFDQEPDMFGVGYAEMEAADTPQEQTPPAPPPAGDGPPSPPAGGAAPPAKSGSAEPAA